MELLQSQKKRYHQLIFFRFQVFIAFTANNFFTTISPRDNPIVIQHSVLTYTLHGHFCFVAGFMSFWVQAEKETGKTGKAG